MKKRIWIDMDGVLVKSISELREYENQEIFDNITSIRGAKEFINIIARFKETYDFDLNICTKTFFPKASPEHQRQKDGKKIWLKTRGIIHHFNTLSILGSDESKCEVVKDVYDILIDDYGKNCKEWQDAGGTAIQMFEEKEKEWHTCQSWMDLISNVIYLLERI